MPVVTDKVIWYGTFAVGVFGAVKALEVGQIDLFLAWLSWIGFFACVKFRARP